MAVPVLILCYLLQLALLLQVAGSKKLFHWYPWAKTLTSVLFLALGVACWLTGEKTLTRQDFALLFAALAACALGDVLLGAANLKGGVHGTLFRFGVAVFGVAHLLFCAVYLGKTGLRLTDLLAAVAALVILTAARKKGWVRLKSMLVPGYLYAALVAVMCANAVSLPFLWQPGLTAVLLAWGSVLFFISDAILLFLYFGTRLAIGQRRWARQANLLFYYLGTMLLALALRH